MENINWTNYILESYEKINPTMFFKICNDIEWNEISNKSLPLPFIQKFIFYLDSKKYPKYNQLSEQFIIKNQDYLDWVSILETQTITKNIYNSCKTHIISILVAMTTKIIDD